MVVAKIRFVDMEACFFRKVIHGSQIFFDRRRRRGDACCALGPRARRR
jgi:hypothetical protein